MSKITKQLNKYSISSDGEYADFIITEGETSIIVIVDSSYGTFSHHWSNTGHNPREFLDHINFDYTMTKFGIDYQVLDKEKQIEYFKKEINRYEGLNEDIEEMREEIEELVSDIEVRNEQHNLYSLIDNYSILQNLYGVDGIEDIRIQYKNNEGYEFFWKTFWKPFTEYLLNEKENKDDLAIGDLVEIQDNKFSGIRLYVIGKEDKFYKLSHDIHSLVENSIVELPKESLVKIKP